MMKTTKKKTMKKNSVDLNKMNNLGYRLSLGTKKKNAAVKLEGGGTRVPVKEHCHYICPEFELRVSLIAAEGNRVYGDKEVSYAELSTGRKGLPLANLVKHARNHWSLFLKGKKDEDHLAKVGWAIQQIMHQQSKDCEHFNILLKPEHRLHSVAPGFEEKG